MRLSRLVPAAFAALALLAAGCIDFEKQSFVVTFDASRDEGHLLMVYEGMQSHANSDADAKRDRELLETFFVHGKAFYLGHPIMMVPLEEKPAAPGKKRDPRDERAQQLIKDHLGMTDLAFFLNKDGALCGRQVLRVKQVSKFVAAINELISEQLIEDSEKMLNDQTKRDKVDLDTLRLRVKAGREKFQWVRHEPGRLGFTLVGSPKYILDLKRELANDMLVDDIKRLVTPPMPPQQPKPLDLAAELKKRLTYLERGAEFLAHTPLSWEHRKDRLSISIGVGDGEPIRAVSPYVPEKKGKTAPLVDHAKTLKVPLLKDATADSVIDEFLAKYPPKK